MARAEEAQTASWYSAKSAQSEGTSGVWTASGERFDEDALTAAMWGVRFGTRVRVTNLRNGKSIIVEINDRGPSRKLVKKGRVIDLSKGAFKAIAPLKSGVIPIRVEVING
jgi:rare lipoprotein A